MVLRLTSSAAGHGPEGRVNELTGGHANFQICRSIPKFPEFWHSESTPVNFARSHFGATEGRARCAGAGGHPARGEAKRRSVAIPPDHRDCGDLSPAF